MRASVMKASEMQRFTDMAGKKSFYKTSRYGDWIVTAGGGDAWAVDISIYNDDPEVLRITNGRISEYGNLRHGIRDAIMRTAEGGHRFELSFLREEAETIVPWFIRHLDTPPGVTPGWAEPRHPLNTGRRLDRGGYFWTMAAAAKYDAALRHRQRRGPWHAKPASGPDA